MKKIIFAIISSVILLASCEDFLTVVPQDSLVSDNYYQDEESLRANTASLYGRVWFSFSSQFQWLAGDQLSGDLYYTYDQEGHFYYNQVGAGNNYNNYGWLGLYRVVAYANSIINDMPSVAAGNGISEEAINRALGEARFIRATAYMYLVEYWGAVPIIENSTALITSSDPTDIYVNRHLQKDVYQFICTDLHFAVDNLPETDSEAARVNKWSAKGMLAKAYLQRAAYAMSDATAGSADDYYAQAKTLAQDVIENSGRALQDYSTLFDVASNNNPESLFAIQCKTGNYGDGSSRNVSWSRGKRIAEQTWGAGKGPTLSLQNLYEAGDLRRPWVYMTSGDYYSMLDTENGGYTYQYTYRDPNDLATQVEYTNEVMAHIKKYVIGKPADCGGNVGQNQDAGNNIYMLRLADVYMIYVEAAMGTGTSTTETGYLNSVRERAGLAAWDGAISFEDLIKERRKEFAFESINWLDLKRYWYRDKSAALNYLNGMQRDQIYRMEYDSTPPYSDMTDADKYTYENDKSHYYLSWQTLSNPDDGHSDRVNSIVFTDASMTIPLPSAVTTTAPILLEDPIAYYDTTNE